MEDIKQIIQQQKDLTKTLEAHYKTERTKILEYIEDHIDSMGEAELKMVNALLITGRTLNTKEYILYTGMHANTVRQNIYSDHVVAVNDLIVDMIINDEMKAAEKDNQKALANEPE